METFSPIYGAHLYAVIDGGKIGARREWGRGGFITRGLLADIVPHGKPRAQRAGAFHVRPRRGAHDRAHVREGKSSETRINTVYFINSLLESRRGITVPRLFRGHCIEFRTPFHP